MRHSEEKVTQIVRNLSQERELPWNSFQVAYRNDYQDYQVLLNNNYRCELREKLIDVYLDNGDPDIKMEIEFRLAHPIELEDWERDDLDLPAAGDDKKDIAVDDSANYDF